ncbi:MAG: hypothetical protein GC179_00990 [Anaerolineaceae bacterium]|nr:hypothetical protein [Anaerolineaceae bacterium]
MWPKINFKLLFIIGLVLTMSVFVVSTIAAQDTGTATDTPTDVPTQEASPTPLPTEVSTELPTAIPTEVPTQIPTAAPTMAPTDMVVAAGIDQTQAPTTEPTTVPTAIPQLVVTQSEPSAITAGQSGSLSILGANFSKSTIVRLIGYGFLTTTYVNTGALTAALPANLPAGVYTVEVSDSTYGTANSPVTLTVNAAAVAATAAPTSTTVPGQPSLVVSNFSANPATIYPGDTTQLTFSVVNVGSRTAEGVVVSLGDTKFTPANGQASITLPDIPASGAVTLTLAATAPSDAAEGPQSIAIVMTSRDFSGQTYTDNATLSVAVAAKNKGESQLVLDSYLVTPQTAAPGDTVTVQALFKNTGTQTASQVLVQLDASSGVLIAGSNGNAFALGDVTAGASVPLTMSLVVASDAKSGTQAQAFNISYLQDDTAKQTTASISVDVEDVVEAAPLILLQSYSVGDNQMLQPDQQFTFNMTLQNAGTVDVSTLLVTFGTVTSSSSTSSSSSTTTASSTQTASTTTINSDSFSIYGSGGTVLVGSLTAGEQAAVKQDFIVNSDLSSGIHDLPITLQYQLADGTTKQQTLDATLFVVVPASIRITSTKTLDDPLTAKTEATLSLKVANIGSSQVNLTNMTVTAENATITTGADITLDPLSASDDVTKTVTFTPDATGDYTLTIAVNYTDDMNRAQTVTQTYSGTVSEAAQTAARPQFTPPNQAQSSQNELGRLLLGFLGIGG